MEFGTPVDISRPIRTVRDREKWIKRLKVDSVLPITWDNMKQRALARVISINYLVPRTRELDLIYPDGRALMEIELLVEPGLSTDNPHFVSWGMGE